MSDSCTFCGKSLDKVKESKIVELEDDDGSVYPFCCNKHAAMFEDQLNEESESESESEDDEEVQEEPEEQEQKDDDEEEEDDDDEEEEDDEDD
jgi:ribosomal protein L24E